MAGHLIYHPQRIASKFGEVLVHYDSTAGNQDPYVWNSRFLHSYCHITQMSPQVGDINFWVTGDRKFPAFDRLYCDLVFVVETKDYWRERNSIERRDPMVDSAEAFNDHYRWSHQHPFVRRRRFTLKASDKQSFQPQTPDGALIDILGPLAHLGLSVEALRAGMRSNRGSRPYRLDDRVSGGLYQWLLARAAIRLTGEELRSIRLRRPELASA